MAHSKDEKFMRLAMEEAEKARLIGEVPIGALIVNENDEIISSGYNTRETSYDPTAHAEIIAIREASITLRTWRLTETTLYVTLEPCAMCMGAIVLSRIKKLVFGVRDPKAGACVSVYSIGVDEKLNHSVEIVDGVMREECSMLLKEFFKQIRTGKKDFR